MRLYDWDLDTIYKRWLARLVLDVWDAPEPVREKINTGKGSRQSVWFHTQQGWRAASHEVRSAMDAAFNTEYPTIDYHASENDIAWICRRRAWPDELVTPEDPMYLLDDLTRWCRNEGWDQILACSRSIREMGAYSAVRDWVYSGNDPWIFREVYRASGLPDFAVVEDYLTVPDKPHRLPPYLQPTGDE